MLKITHLSFTYHLNLHCILYIHIHASWTWIMLPRLYRDRYIHKCFVLQIKEYLNRLVVLLRMFNMYPIAHQAQSADIDALFVNVELACSWGFRGNFIRRKKKKKNAMNSCDTEHFDRQRTKFWVFWKMFFFGKNWKYWLLHTCNCAFTRSFLENLEKNQQILSVHSHYL